MAATPPEHGSDHQPAPLVTISASYGAGGSVIAPRLAERLGLPFVDRVFASEVPAADSGLRHRCAPSKEGLTADEEATAPTNRLFQYLARAAGVGGMLTPDVVVDEDDSIRRQAEADLLRAATGRGGVLLGRAGAVVLTQRPRAYHVRLDGPAPRRIERAAELEGIDPKQAAERQAQTDRARVLYVRRLYRGDPSDTKWYHLLLDTTALPLDSAVDVIHTAATAFFKSN